MVLLATAISGFAYIVIGLRLGRHINRLGDHIPVDTSGRARVLSGSEYSTTTIATTISLATVVLAFFDLAPFLGLWLLWTAVTTAAGMIVVRLQATRILSKMAAYGSHRPTLHEFLGTEYGSPGIALIGAFCTTVGYIGAMSVELTVGALFFAQFVPSLPKWAAVVIIALIGFTYTSLGGFRVVVITDRIQMAVIWVLIASLGVFYVSAIVPAPTVALGRIPASVTDFSLRPGLLAFLIGIFIINVPAYVSDMGMWQRIAGSRDEGTIYKGLSRSVLGVLVSWSLLVVAACLVPAAAWPGHQSTRWIFDLLRAMSDSLMGRILLIPVMLGLYGALFSTASTQLIALSHTLQMDIIERRRRPTSDEEVNSQAPVARSRWLMGLAAVIGVVVVQLLSAAGFTIADLVFAVYGGQIALFPVVYGALRLSRERLRNLAPIVNVLLPVSFVAGWATAIIGKLSGSGNAVFLAPAVSFGTAALGIAVALAFSRSHAVVEPAA